MKKIPIYKKIDQQVGFVIVDDDDFDKVNATKWYISGRRYASATKKVNGKWTAVYLHKVIKPTSEHGKVVDHINGDTFDNRKQNLRVCTKQQNVINSTTRKDNTSGHRGIYRMVKKGKIVWIAKAVFQGKQHHFGTHHSKDEAMTAYRANIKMIFGEYARV